MDLPIQETLKSLPRWAIVAFAARCARRVEPLFLRAWPEAPVALWPAVSQAVAYAEQCAARAGCEPSLAKVLALQADYASHQATFGPEAVVFSGAYEAAHAAANAAGVVAYKEEAATGAYYAAEDAAGALARVLGQGTEAILEDLERLTRAAAEQGWTNATPVLPEFFAPLPEIRSEDEEARCEAYFTWERAGRPALSPEEQRRMYLEALDRVRRNR